MMTSEQKTLHERLRAEEKKDWDSPQMVDYCVSDCEYVVPLENGGILAIQKPRIQTRFCFGYGSCGILSDGEEQKAEGEAKDVRDRSERFIEENVERADFSSILQKLANHDLIATMRKSPTSDIWHLWFTTEWMLAHDDERQGLSRLTLQDKAELFRGLRAVDASFRKRLDVYLKKFGTSKLRTWTFVED